MNTGNKEQREVQEVSQEKQVVSTRHEGSAGSQGSSRWKHDMVQRDGSHGLGMEQRGCGHVWFRRGGGAEKGRGLVGRSENWKTVSLPLSLG